MTWAEKEPTLDMKEAGLDLPLFEAYPVRTKTDLIEGQLPDTPTFLRFAQLWSTSGRPVHKPEIISGEVVVELLASAEEQLADLAEACEARVPLIRWGVVEDSSWYDPPFPPGLRLVAEVQRLVQTHSFDLSPHSNHPIVDIDTFTAAHHGVRQFCRQHKAGPYEITDLSERQLVVAHAFDEPATTASNWYADIEPRLANAS